MTLEGTAPMVRSQSGLERLDSVEQSLSDIVRRVDQLDKSTEDIRSDIARVRDSIASMEGDMRELTSLYDLISTQINPFIESEMEARASITAMEEEGETGIPELDALFEPTPEIAAEGEDFGDIFGEEAPSEGAMFAEVEEVEGEAAFVAEVEAVPTRMARLTKVGDAPTCHIALLRWIEFMMDKVPRKEIPNLLSFYVKIGWISTGIKSETISVIRGMVGEELEDRPSKAKKHKKAKGGKGKDKDGDVVMTYDKEDLHELARSDVRRGQVRRLEDVARGPPQEPYPHRAHPRGGPGQGIARGARARCHEPKGRAGRLLCPLVGLEGLQPSREGRDWDSVSRRLPPSSSLASSS